jgi:hypothetical protein
MALNITMDGFVYMESGSLSSSNVAYQAYFYKSNAGSSPSKWNNKRIVEATGYWNINLGDGDWLTQDGSASSGDHIIIVFWNPASADRMDACSYLTEWSCFRITLDGSSTYSNDVQVRSNICPNLNWSVPTDGLVGQNITANNTSTDIHQWDFFSNTMYHKNIWHTTLMSINLVDNSDYDWGDGNQDNDLSGITNGVHTYSASGDYDIQVVIEDACGCTVTGTDQIRVYKRPPVPDIVMVPSDPEPNEPVYFQYVGDDVDSTITQIIWSIEDDTNTITTVYDKNDTVAHTEGTGTLWCGEARNNGAFTDAGNHKVFISISWFDGFNIQTMPYDETFFQKKFTGPTVNFIQDPAEAEKDSPVRFSNLTTNTDRVGTGLNDCFEYTWRWSDADGLLVETEIDVPITYELERTPTTAMCKTQLCAQWSDGWKTHNTCVEKDVVFKTTVTVTEEDCYYNLNLIGTSDNGSVTGYGWTISSGISETGPWVDTWSSPTGPDQNDKKICFTSLGWYKIVGTVYGTGNPTSDDEIMYITTVCPAGDSIKNLWNGTGIQDAGSDWDHSGFGTETEQSKHAGTYGLDATNMSKNTSIVFSAPGASSVTADDYDFLRLWVNVRSWQANKDMSIQFHTIGSANSDTIDLNSYLDTSKTGIWQKVMIPLSDFRFSSDSIYLKKLILKAGGDMGVWLDDIALSMGTLETEAIAVCPPDVTGREIDESKKMRARELKPGLRGRLSIQPSARIIGTPFPGPKNI